MIRALSTFAVAMIVTASATLAIENNSVQLAAQNGSGVNGTAMLHETKGPNVVVAVKTTGFSTGSVSIDHGTCGHVTAKAEYTLTPLKSGTSTSTIKSIDLSTFGKTPYVLIVGTPAKACGQLQGE